MYFEFANVRHLYDKFPWTDSVMIYESVSSAAKDIGFRAELNHFQMLQKSGLAPRIYCRRDSIVKVWKKHKFVLETEYVEFSLQYFKGTTFLASLRMRFIKNVDDGTCRSATNLDSISFGDGFQKKPKRVG